MTTATNVEPQWQRLHDLEKNLYIRLEEWHAQPVSSGKKQEAEQCRTRLKTIQDEVPPNPEPAQTAEQFDESVRRRYGFFLVANNAYTDYCQCKPHQEAMKAWDECRQCVDECRQSSSTIATAERDAAFAFMERLLESIECIRTGVDGAVIQLESLSLNSMGTASALGRMSEILEGTVTVEDAPLVEAVGRIEERLTTLTNIIAEQAERDESEDMDEAKQHPPVTEPMVTQPFTVEIPRAAQPFTVEIFLEHLKQVAPELYEATWKYINGHDREIAASFYQSQTQVYWHRALEQCKGMQGVDAFRRELFRRFQTSIWERSHAQLTTIGQN